GVPSDRFHRFGPGRAKIDPRYLPSPSSEISAGSKNPSSSLYVLVTGMTPTPLGEGKTTTSIGLSMAMNRIGCRTVVTIRQPSMGPVFGIKGGGAGGGKSTIEPMDVLNLHLTGDIHAVSAAHNLLASAIDNDLCHGNATRIDPLSIHYPRVVDLNDRPLRKVVIGLGGRANGIPRETEFSIAVSSEVMAILALSRDYADLSSRLSKITVGSDVDGRPVTARDLGVDGAMSALLREAFWPNLMATCEGTPAIVHGSPFANIAHGNSSVIGDWVALSGAECVVTEAGFGADLGGEKFFDIKVPILGRGPNVAVLVATAKSLRMHGGLADTTAGKPIPEILNSANPESVDRGCANLRRQIENIRRFGVPVVVAINSHPQDSQEEWDIIRRHAIAAGASDAVVCTHFRDGSEGALDLARVVLETARSHNGQVIPLYRQEDPLEEKVRRIVTTMYGGKEVAWSDKAKKSLSLVRSLGGESMAVCIAKTWASLSHDPSLKGDPRGYVFPVTDVRAFTGAGFVTVYAGDVQTMPGLPSIPSFRKIDLSPDGITRGIT
ncbi:MAG: formate--tetrahydrofolate ligase, partial [Leptospirillum sp.]